MRDYDRLPAELRRWLATATLPWGPKSARRAYDKALARTGTASRAIAEMEALQLRLIAKDASRIWGKHHPDAAPPQNSV